MSAPVQQATIILALLDPNQFKRRMNTNARPEIPVDGVGKIIAELHGPRVVFPELSYTYPLKLLSPKVGQNDAAIVYVLGYGGGLVGGDCITISVNVGSGAHLMLLTQAEYQQGSTKVFKVRSGSRKAVRSTTAGCETRQRLCAHVASGGALFLLPDPVTCFANASYHQIQAFQLEHGASAVLLDWYTSGRRARGEEWAFSQYRSVTEVFVSGLRIARDAVVLEGQANTKDAEGLILYGPALKKVSQALDDQFSQETVLRVSAPPNLLWSVSPLRGSGGESGGRMVRVAGRDTEDVKVWLKGALGMLADVVGQDVYSKAFV